MELTYKIKSLYLYSAFNTQCMQYVYVCIYSAVDQTTLLLTCKLVVDAEMLDARTKLILALIVFGDDPENSFHSFVLSSCHPPG